jgi:hypothetical protein
LWLDKEHGERFEELLPWDLYNSLKAEFGDPHALESVAYDFVLWQGQQVEGADTSAEQFLREDIAVKANVKREERFAMRDAGMPEESIIAIQKWKAEVAKAEYDERAGQVALGETTDGGLAPGEYVSRNGKPYTVDDNGNRNFEKGYISPDGQWHWYNDYTGGSAGGSSGWIPNKYGGSGHSSGWIPNKYGQDNRQGWVDYDVGETTDNINFRSDPGMSSAVRRVMHMGENFSVLDEMFMDDERWLRVRTSTGEMGWVMARYAKRRGKQRSGRDLSQLGDSIAFGVKSRQYRGNRRSTE